MTLTHTIDRDALVQDICDMVATFSVNPYDDPAAPAEAAMADLFEAKLIALGVEVDSHVVSEGRRNVWGRLKGSGQGPTILLAGHLDTVGVDGYDAPFTPHLKDGRVYGRGSCDMKAGVASYLAVVRAMKASGTQLQGDLVVAGLVDEEHAMHGSAYFGKHGPKADYALVAEPSQLAICPMHKGQVLVTLTTTGKSVHSSLPHLGTNAVYHMAAIVTALQGYANDLSQRPPHP
ncbi:MAG: M20 family metallopeptidase, partial [Planktomarina sp.]